MNTKENTLVTYVVPTGKMQIRLDFACKHLEHNAFTFPITSPTQKFNILIKCNYVSRLHSAFLAIWINEERLIPGRAH